MRITIPGWLAQRWRDRACGRKAMRLLAGAVLTVAGVTGPHLAQAQETVCARVKIEIKQELTLERQAFDAEMKINNALDNASLEEVSVQVRVTDEAGAPVEVTSDPNDLGAKFFIRLSHKENIADVDGSGAVAPATTATVNWLIIPAPGSAGSTPFGKKYLVGATLKYKFGAETHTLDVSPDVITVKPLPLLTLDYFLTEDVLSDDPLTPQIEPTVPFTLGVRVRNNGQATAKNLKIDSAQPKIIENEQGLLINFQLTGSYVDDAPVQNTLLVDFGDIAPGVGKMGRWVMETSLAGKFTEFSARFSHADELGGALTSILEATNAHFLIRDVRVDLPGRDPIRDFLAKDADLIRVFESEGTDSLVADRSGVAQLTVSNGGTGEAGYRLEFPPTDGFIYVRLPDPFGGQKALAQVVRSDAKLMAPENVWLSRTRNEQTKQWHHWINFFDVNTPGVYQTGFQAPPTANLPPQIQYIPDRTVKEGQQVSFLVEASSPGGKPVTMSAAPLPTGAVFTQQAPDPQAPGLVRAVFDWTPPKGTAGSYLVVYSATDGSLTSTRSARIKVEALEPPSGPGTPTIGAPVSGAQVATLTPVLSVLTPAREDDPTVKLQFEVYRDAEMTQLVAEALVDRGATTGGATTTTAWQMPDELPDNTMHWWRARSFDGDQTYSQWVHGRFFVNLQNDPPEAFNLASPAPGIEVGTLQPLLSWSNSVDPDGDAVSYAVTVYKDAGLTEVETGATGLVAGADGTTDWTVDKALTNHVRYYWEVVAQDSGGAQTASATSSFVVNTGNTAPAAPVIVSPPPSGESASPTTVLVIQSSSDAENDLITYVFEIDTVASFDSGAKRTSGQVIQGASQTVTWAVDGLVENRRYYWRVKAQDGRAESAWTTGDFLMNAVNDVPTVPTVHNPGDGAWVSSLHPTLEANPAVDPEGAKLRYQFEVYNDAARVEGLSDDIAWRVTTPLADKTHYWWRVRALDDKGATSAWSAAARIYVSTGVYQDPVIQMTGPATHTVPTTDGNGRKYVTINWEGADPNIAPKIALYYTTDNADFAGNLIVDGLEQPVGTHDGSHAWDVTDLQVGVYYVYGVIYDERGTGRAWAPGAVVIVPDSQTGKVNVTARGKLTTTEGGGEARFTVRLDSAPVSDVTVPVVSTDMRKGVTSPPSLVFTPDNWRKDQEVTVTGVTDCLHDREKRYQVLVGPAVSLDPQYMGKAGKTLKLRNLYDGSKPAIVTNNDDFRICSLSVRSEKQLAKRTWEYVIDARIGNGGPAVNGVKAQLVGVPKGFVIVEGELQFGALQQGDTGRSLGTITLHSKKRLRGDVVKPGSRFKWEVVTQ